MTKQNTVLKFERVAARVAATEPVQRPAARERVLQKTASYGRQLSGCDRAVVEALLNRINWRNGYAFPGLKRLAADTGYSVRQVTRARGKLARIGIIVTQALSSEHSGHDALRVTFPLLTQMSGATDTDVTSPTDADVIPLVTRMSDKPVKVTNEDKPASSRQRRSASSEADADFEAFWIIYPRKVARKTAASAWGRMTPNQRAQAMAALPHYCAQIKKKNTALDYVCYAATWLNQERYADTEHQPQDPIAKSDTAFAALWKEAQQEELATQCARMNGGPDALH